MPIDSPVTRILLPLLTIASLVYADSAVDRQLASAARQRVAMTGMTASLKFQQASVRRQVQAPVAVESSFFVVLDPTAPEPSGGDCAVLPVFTARGMVESAARTAGIDPNLLQAVAAQESAFRPCAISPKGAQGLMQLMPATAMDLGVRNPFDPAENLAGGAALLKQLMTRYSGDLNRVLGAYNAGPSRVDAADGVPAIPETISYVDKILGKLR